MEAGRADSRCLGQAWSMVLAREVSGAIATEVDEPVGLRASEMNSVMYVSLDLHTTSKSRLPRSKCQVARFRSAPQTFIDSDSLLLYIFALQ